MYYEDNLKGNTALYLKDIKKENKVLNFKVLNKSPRMYIETNSTKFSDVNITFTDYSGLEDDKIVFYEASNGVKGEKISKNKLVKNIDYVYKDNKKVKIIYTIKSKYLNKKTNSFYVEVIDKNNSDYKLEAFFRIKATNKRYKADYPPRTLSWKLDGKYIKFIARDLKGVDYIRVYDLNSNKLILEEKKLKSGDTELKIKVSDLTSKNDKYKLKIEAQDNNKDEKQSVIRFLAFSL